MKAGITLVTILLLTAGLAWAEEPQANDEVVETTEAVEVDEAAACAAAQPLPEDEALFAIWAEEQGFPESARGVRGFSDSSGLPRDHQLQQHPLHSDAALCSDRYRKPQLLHGFGLSPLPAGTDDSHCEVSLCRRRLPDRIFTDLRLRLEASKGSVAAVATESVLAEPLSCRPL